MTRIDDKVIININKRGASYMQMKKTPDSHIYLAIIELINNDRVNASVIARKNK